ncbi:MAG: sulfur carrier protein ThiS [Proteobacteria bacterium]|nr:MAG: sulfur carrier protein ThiS [Pseudomonadota bacterium]
MQSQMEIKIHINGKPSTFKETLSIDQLLSELGYKDHFVAVAVNSQCILRKNYGTHQIQSADEIEILAPMAGG